MVFIWREISARALVAEMVLAWLRLAKFAEPIPTKASSGWFLRASLTNWGKLLGILFCGGGFVPAAGAMPVQLTTANITHRATNATAIFFIPFYSSCDFFNKNIRSQGIIYHTSTFFSSASGRYFRKRLAVWGKKLYIVCNLYVISMF
jgi:hypothetical protein